MPYRSLFLRELNFDFQRDTTGNISTSGQQPYDVPGSAPMDPGTQGRNNYDNNVRSHQQAPYDGAGQTGPVSRTTTLLASPL